MGEHPRMPFEIIEIGAVKVDKNLNIIDEYSSLIKPKIYNFKRHTWMFTHMPIVALIPFKIHNNIIHSHVPLENLLVKNSAPDGIRTHDLPLRRRTLYPAELQMHINYKCNIYRVYSQGLTICP